MVSDSLFKADLEALRGRAYQALVTNQFMIQDVSLGEKIRFYPNTFNTFWDGVAEVLQRDRANNNRAQMYEYYDAYTPEEWIAIMERWASANITDFVSDINNDEIFSIKTSKGNENILDEFLTALNSQMTNALFKDSENRADLIIDFLQDKAQEFTDTFGMDGTELIYSILSGLKKEEAQRLGGPKPVTATAEVLEKNDEEVIDELDFLDDDIDEVFNLEELEEELDLDDLNLD